MRQPSHQVLVSPLVCCPAAQSLCSVCKSAPFAMMCIRAWWAVCTGVLAISVSARHEGCLLRREPHAHAIWLMDHDHAAGQQTPVKGRHLRRPCRSYGSSLQRCFKQEDLSRRLRRDTLMGRLTTEGFLFKSSWMSSALALFSCCQRTLEILNRLLGPVHLMIEGSLGKAPHM